MNELRAPFPWFGGKSKVAEVVWRAFGYVPNYVEPFAGSLAVMLGRPHGRDDGIALAIARKHARRTAM